MQQDVARASQPDESADQSTGVRANRRAEPRRAVQRIPQIMRVCRVVFDRAGNDFEACSVLDASDNGYRVHLSVAREVELGTRVVFEHLDGTRKFVRLCWSAGQELGLQIDWTFARILLDEVDRDGIDCKFLGTAGNIHRVEYTGPEKFPVGREFMLETANGVRHAVRVRWLWERELGLQMLKPAGKKRA
jgi:hypothetical protein